MVARLWGKCLGQEISFSQNEDTGRWETAVPASQNGVYILELWAEDFAGNRGYFATVEVSWDSTQLCAHIRILEVGSRFSMAEVRRALLGDGVQAKLLGDPVLNGMPEDPVRCRVVRCERCGE